MKKFCRECGKEVGEEHSHCRHCGTPLTSNSIKEGNVEQNQQMTRTENQVTEQNTVQKQPMTKKNKVVLGSVITVIILIISFHMWANNYYSYESVEKRFADAVGEEDVKELAQLAMHEDGSSIGKHEAKAFSSLVKSGGKVYLSDLTNVVLDGKFLGMYDSYKVEVLDQFATYDNFVEGLTFEFNEKEFPVFEKNDNYITYGPLAPGEYTIEAKYESDSGETSMEDTFTAASSFGEPTWIDMEIPISMVSFHVENYYDFETTEAYIILNEEEYEISPDGDSEEIGPFITDGSQHINVVVNMPWGEIMSENIPVDESYMYVLASLITNEDYEEITKVLTTFGDEYINAVANKTTKPLTTVTDILKKEVEYEYGDDVEYTAQFEELQIDKSSLSINLYSDTPEVSIDVRYLISDSVHYLEDSPVLAEEEYTWNLNLIYNEEEWLIDSLMYADIWTEESELDVIEGSNTLYGPNPEKVQTAKEGNLEADIEEFMIDYAIAGIDAINDRSFDIVEGYLTDDGPRKKESREYIDYLDSKDIYEDWLGTELESVKEIEDNSWEVTVIEEFNIIRPDSSDVKEFRTVVVVKLIDDMYYVDELIETNEI